MVGTRRVAYAVVLAAVGVALAPFTSFPIGIAKVNPTQHFVNVLGAVILGPWWATLVAFVVAILRNALGVGTLLAFPGGMIGAFLAGFAFRATKSPYAAAAGEIAGTGLLAPLVGAALVAPVFMGRSIGFLALLPSFLASTVVGAVLGVLALRLLRRADLLPRRD
ncbi:MAG: energy coupling factor transporter S component ThiW [Deltaproteobacteria bacterium]|nr:energy coupling factor transporter S component ThiW [Deltaproteobacteria bacterium]